MIQPELEISEVPTSNLVPYANNAKLHGKLQVEQIANSISEFGFNDPVGVWENPEGGLEIVEGHGRVLAAEKLGIGTVPTVRLDHLTDEQRRAYAHVHNQTTLNSGFDLETLDAELETLDFDWESFGFDQAAGGYEEFEDLSGRAGDVFEVIVSCSGEDEQEAVYRKLTDEGYECRVLTL